MQDAPQVRRVKGSRLSGAVAVHRYRTIRVTKQLAQQASALAYAVPHSCAGIHHHAHRGLLRRLHRSRDVDWFIDRRGAATAVSTDAPPNNSAAVNPTSAADVVTTCAARAIGIISTATQQKTALWSTQSLPRGTRAKQKWETRVRQPYVTVHKAYLGADLTAMSALKRCYNIRRDREMESQRWKAAGAASHWRRSAYLATPHVHRLTATERARSPKPPQERCARSEEVAGMSGPTPSNAPPCTVQRVPLLAPLPRDC